MRTKGSCRFKTYFKVEVWSDKNCCWVPIQKTYETRGEAEKSATGKFRVMEFSEKGIK